MKITKLMDEYYKGLLLTPDIYYSLDLGIHIELGEDIYQINDDENVREELLQLLLNILKDKNTDDIRMVLNISNEIFNRYKNH